MTRCAECDGYPAGTVCSYSGCPGKQRRPIAPQISDGEGHQFKGVQRLSYDAWEYACLLELVEAHAAGRRVSFKIPSSDHVAEVAHD